MKKICRWVAGFGGLMLLCAAASFAGVTSPGCPANQNPNAATHGAGKSCTQGNNSNVAVYQPIRLKLNIKPGEACPDPAVPILVSPDVAVVHRGDTPPNRVLWLVTGKSNDTTWEIEGITTRYQHGATIAGANPFPGTMSISGTDDAYWTDDIDGAFPTPTTTSIEWEYSIKVSWGGEQPKCSPVEIDPIIIFPGG